MRLERENPLLTSARNPERFIKTNIKDTILTEGSISEDTVELNLDLSGLSSFTQFNNSTRNRSNISQSEVVSNGRVLKQVTSFEEDDKGMISIVNKRLEATRCSPKGTGTRTIVAQVTAALAQGNVKEIVVEGKTEDKTHYIWPKLGFNAEVKLDFLVNPSVGEDESEEGRTKIKIREWFTSNRRKVDENGEVCLLDLYSCVDVSNNLIGQEYWLNNGYPVQLKMNLSSSSASLKFFNKYF